MDLSMCSPLKKKEKTILIKFIDIKFTNPSSFE